MIGTLWAALHMHSYVLSIIFCVAQVCLVCHGSWLLLHGGAWSRPSTLLAEGSTLAAHSGSGVSACHGSAHAAPGCSNARAQQHAGCTALLLPPTNKQLCWRRSWRYCTTCCPTSRVARQASALCCTCSCRPSCSALPAPCAQWASSQGQLDERACQRMRQLITVADGTPGLLVVQLWPCSLYKGLLSSSCCREALQCFPAEVQEKRCSIGSPQHPTPCQAGRSCGQLHAYQIWALMAFCFLRSFLTTPSMMTRKTAATSTTMGASRTSTSSGYIRGVTLDMVLVIIRLLPRSGVLMW